MLRINITIPQEEYEEAKEKIPYGEARTFSAIVRVALKKLQPKK